MKDQRGFTLVELMIVIVIIAIIAALAIPNLLRSRASANEASAVSNLRTISTAETQFRTALLSDADNNGDGDYGTLSQLATPPDGRTPFIDSELGQGSKQGYVYVLEVTQGSEGTSTSYRCIASPYTQNKTGVRRFYINDSGVLRYTNDGSEPGPASTIVN